ncbi:MAG: class I SAM-dependent methyltransferase [Pseudomonadota bacterium]
MSLFDRIRPRKPQPAEAQAEANIPAAPSGDKARLSNLADTEGMLWGEDVAEDYHGRATRDMALHWRMFLADVFARHTFDLARSVDIAAGFGRNTRKLLELGAGHVIAVDVNPDCIARLETNFANDPVTVLHNNGHDIAGIDAESRTFVYSFDAMVHFDTEIVFAYIHEFFRVLEPGGMALIHHSNFTGNPGGDFRDNPHWRNYMSLELFGHIAKRGGFEIVDQVPITWGIEGLDGITVLRRPA